MSERMLTVATFANPVEANLAKNRLEAADIKAALVDQEAVAMVWHLANAFGGIKLQVSEKDAEEAIAILARIDHDELPQSGGTEANSLSSDDMEHVAGDPAEMPDKPEPALTTRDENADRAWRGAVLGLLLAPLQLYVFWLLLKVLCSNERLRSDKRKRAFAAAMINLPLVFGFCSALIFLWLDLHGSSGRNEFELDPAARDTQVENFIRGEAAFEKGNFDLAFKWYSRAIDLDHVAYTKRGMAYLGKREPRRALTDFDNAIELDPTNSGAYSERAKAHRALRDEKGADRDDDKARKLIETERATHD